MGGIGDYVHFHARNYNSAGTSHAGTGVTYSGAYSFESQLNNIKAKINSNKSSLSDQELKSIQNQLSYILSNAETDNGNLTNFANDILQATKKEMDIQRQNVKWETGNVQITDITSKKNSAIRIIKSANDDKNRRISTITNRINALLGIQGQIESEEKKDELLTKIGNIKTSLNSILGVAEKDVQAMLGSGQAKTFNKYFKNQGLSDTEITTKGKQINSLVADLNNIINELDKVIPVNNQKGALWEYIIAGLKGLAESEALNEVKITMSEVVGGHRNAGDVTINTQNINSNLSERIISLMNLKLQEGSTNIYVTGNKSQQKVDVKLTLDSGKKAKVSAKNTNLMNNFDIDLVKSAPFFSMLQDQDSEFVNHYLNLVASHPTSALDAVKISEARKAVKMTVFWNALSGDTYGRETVDLFILNNNVSKGADSIYVIDLSTMAKKAMEDLNKFVTIKLQLTDGESTGTSIDNLLFENRWVQGYYEYEARNANLLIAAQNVKVNVALKKSLIRNYYKN